ncbi:hypothetical protein [Tenuifilum thalassicum]|uniref:Redoxin domain-containing protein n=1 Tax=Tenuifilum thalassicum TaxID=2590900 RepID=A0A7D3XJS6_9BACT|nr:hypothetical protein [Tenuifilum thalassicum]QKG79190.1 hypothetical protein FHG85_02565 [Tenuifilum thalassicum]
MKSTKTLFHLLVLILFSCSRINTNKDECNTSLLNKKLILPDSISVVTNDTISFHKTSEVLALNKPTLIITIWGDCHVCAHKTFEWADFINHNKLNIQTLLVVITDTPSYFLRIFSDQIPEIGIVAIDKRIINENNLCELRPDLNVFLIDPNQFVRIQGDPFIYKELKEKYLKMIKSNSFE